MKRELAALANLSAALFSLCAAAIAKPNAVSLDYCSDQYLLKLGDADQIAGVSRGADKDYSFMREAAGPFKKIRANREEVFALAPDLIFRQWGGGANADTAYARFGAKVITLSYSEDFDGVAHNIKVVAAALDQTARGEALINDMEARLKALAGTQRANARINALYVTPGGVTAGAHTMIDAIISAAGAVNVAAARGKTYFAALSVEALLLAPPEFIVAGFFHARDEDVNYWSAARHPALLRLLEATPGVNLSADVLSCAGWYGVDAAEHIASAIAAQRTSAIAAQRK